MHNFQGEVMSLSASDQTRNGGRTLVGLQKTRNSVEEYDSDFV